MKSYPTYYGLDEQDCAPDRAKAVLLPCPYDRTVSYQKGTVNGPRAIFEASVHIEEYDGELNQETYQIGLHTARPLPLQKLAPDEMVGLVRRETLRVLQAGALPVIVGGEHSVSIGAVQAVSEVQGEFSVLHLDAHCDLRQEYHGSVNNHACVARRFLERAPVVQVGVRSLSREESEFIAARPAGLCVISLADIRARDDWTRAALDALSENVYVSVDLDLLDPSIMPAVGTPEPGGLGWTELLVFLREVAARKNILGFDVVELMPIKGLAAPDYLAAKLIYKLLGYTFAGRA